MARETHRPERFRPLKAGSSGRIYAKGFDEVYNSRARRTFSEIANHNDAK